MLGSSVLDIAIGLTFVYLLLSLIVTASSEVIAGWLKRRQTTLWQGVVNLLGEAWAGKLYDHPLIKGLSPPPKPKWAETQGFGETLWFFLRFLNVAAEGPSYIPSRTFALSLLDTLGFGLDRDFDQRIRRVLDSIPDTVLDGRRLKNTLLAAANSSLAGGPNAVREFQACLLTIPDTVSYHVAVAQVQTFLNANPGKFADLAHVVAAMTTNLAAPTFSSKDIKNQLLQALGSPPTEELLTLLERIPDSASVDLLKQEVVRFLDRRSAANPLTVVPAGLEGTDVANALRSLWDDAGHDLEKFKASVESWFNDAMDRVSGWYKRQTQLVNLILAVALTLALNVDTLLLVDTLSHNSTLRESLVAQATKFAQQPPEQLQSPRPATPEAPALSGEASPASTNESFSLVLAPNQVASGDALKGILTLKETNAVDLTFALSSSPPALVSMSPRVTVPRGEKTVSFPITTRPQATSARVAVAASNKVALLLLTPDPQAQLRAAQAQLQNLNLPIGWVVETNTHTPAPGGTASNPDVNHQRFLVFVPPTHRLFWSTVAFHWIGWLVTALAVSLGAPFWFDLLAKFITIRSAGAPPTTPENKP